MAAKAVHRAAVMVAIVVVAAVGAVVVVPSTADGAFPGANGKIVYYEQGLVDAGLTIMNPDGSDRRSILGAREISTPRWSADGQKLVYGRSNGARSAVYVETRDADGSNPQRVTEETPGLYDRSPVWSPDGSQIVFTRMEHFSEALYVIDVGGTNLRQLTDPAEESVKPTSWSPDGSTILFDREVETEQGEVEQGVWAISPDGSDERLLAGADRPALGGDFSPDGTRIVFSATPPGERFQLHTMATDGSQVEQLTHEDLRVVNGVWSPDGQQVVAQLVSYEQGYTSALVYYAVSDGRLIGFVKARGQAAEAPNWQPIAAGPSSAPPVGDEPSTTTTTSGPVVAAPAARAVTTAPRLTG